MAASLTQQDLLDDGLPESAAAELWERLRALPEEPATERWRRLTATVLHPGLPFAVHQRLFAATYADWDPAQGPPPAWLPDPAEVPHTNLGRLMADLGLPDYAALHRWSVEQREAFWAAAIERLHIRFDQPYEAVAAYPRGPETPDWLPGARLNLAASCFQAPPERIAVRWQQPGGPLQECTYGELDALSNRVANGLVARGFRPGDAVAVALPMSVAAIAAYLGIVKMGGVVVSVTDSFSAPEIALRLRLGGAVGAICQDFASAARGEPLYDKLVAANAPLTIVLAAADPGAEPDLALRDDDLAWPDFLADDDVFTPVPRRPDDLCNVLFSSGTTADPKAIPWTHTTPLRAAADGHFHHDLRPGDVVCWPTSLGWMMGPWLVFASLINHATIAVFEGTPLGRGFGEFIRDAGVTMLGLVPSLVKSWRSTRCFEGLDLRGVRRFSSTGECSNAVDYLYLMMLAGYRPVIEYCGGTEIGGGYLTGTMVQPASPGTFSTPALGLDFVLLDDAGQPTRNGELFLVPPSIGLSNTLLNQDHHEVYYAGVPTGPRGELLRRHGDQMEALGGGYYRSHGRADDAMNLKGIKISSAELERALAGAPGLVECAAVAVSDPDGGPSRLVIYAVVDDPRLDRRQLRPVLQQALRQHYGAQFKVADVQILDRLPRTASNKVMRRVLRDDYLQRHGDGHE